MVLHASTAVDGPTLLKELDLGSSVYLATRRHEAAKKCSSGLQGIDELLQGGWCRGRINELVGARSCGKTSLFLSLAASLTERGESLAHVDITDALSPQSWQAAGVELGHVLWVRPPNLKVALKCTEVLLKTGGFGAVSLDFGKQTGKLRQEVWPRLSRCAEKSQTPLLLLAPGRVAGTFSNLSLSIQRKKSIWQQEASRLFDGFQMEAIVSRNKLGAVGATQDLDAIRMPIYC